MAAYLPNRNNAKSLTAQIRDAEQQVLKRQRGVAVRFASLVSKTQRQMTAPASLLLAGGVGFLLGELTQRQLPKAQGTADKPRAAGTSALKIALNLIASARTLYTGLVPLAWMIKSFSNAGRNVEQGPSPEPSPYVRPPSSLGCQ